MVKFNTRRNNDQCAVSVENVIEFLKKICTRFFFCKVRNVRKWLLPVSYWNLGRKIGVFFIYCFFSHTEEEQLFVQGRI